MNKPQITDEEFLYLQEQESQWRNSKVRLSEKEELEVYPAIIEYLPDMIANRSVQVTKARDQITEEIRKIKFRKLPEVEEYLCLVWIRLTLIEPLVKIEKQIKKFQRLLDYLRPIKQKTKITELQINKVLSIPMIEVISRYVEMKKSGSRWIGKCPFHSDKTPSLISFEDHYHCFGCGEHGNNINFIRQIESCGFIEAVQRLTNEN